MEIKNNKKTKVGGETSHLIVGGGTKSRSGKRRKSGTGDNKTSRGNICIPVSI